jgi:hypothetical protein
MALVEHWRTDFNTDAKVQKFFYSPYPGGLSAIVHPRRVVTADDAVSCIEINIGNEVPDKEYFSTPWVGGLGQDAYDKMVADIGTRTAGQVLYCYSNDNTKHGRYVVQAGPSLGARTGSVSPKMVDDENHRRITQIRLLLQSYSAHGDAFAPPALGYPDFSALNASIGRPATDDLSGWVMRWRMRAQNMSMGRKTKIAQHFQTRIPGAPRIGTYDWGADPLGDGSVAFVNAFNQATCISDELGFGGGGLYAANTTEYVADSGWVDIDIPLEPLWSHWLMMGGGTNKDGHEGAAYTHPLRYVVSNPAVWVKNWTGNAYLCEAQFNPDSSVDLPVIPNEESVKGRLLVSALSFLRAA